MFAFVGKDFDAADVARPENAPTVPVAGHVSDPTRDQPSLQGDRGYSDLFRGVFQTEFHRSLASQSRIKPYQHGSRGLVYKGFIAMSMSVTHFLGFRDGRA
jgi:hypothetical protein